MEKQLNKQQKYNKGEWSEPYVLLKLLAEGKLYGADANLEAIPNLFYPLINILRFEAGTKYTYEYENYSFEDSTNISIVDGQNNTLVSIPIKDFKEKALALFEEIKKGNGTFSVSKEIDDFLNTIEITRKAEQSTKKRDITIVVHDEQTGNTPELGFSIKSKLGGPATLLNAGHTTNFIYKFEGGTSITETDLKNINIDPVATMKEKAKGKTPSEKTIKDKAKYGYEPLDKLKNTGEIINQMEKRGYSLKFLKTENEIFQGNLEMFDSNFPFLLSDILISNAKKECGNQIDDVLKFVEEKNPLNYNLKNKHPMYSYKIKNFLTDASAGLMPSIVWEGTYDANGGYIIVKSDGELVCYHIYNRNEFQDYLVKNTYLEQGSRFKHGFGFVYRQEDELYINLNLQIRFN
ncbi:HpaII family restriction endonuclease [Lysinibacillus fusiformis]|uniref:HpaII family restriction endonuclease n=1 Tax=Lysinibacillus fusiformis TaxID=28031 RepID=UPI0012470115|nr:HpaII family restriction endonuclease [Lysinibacillus fusiformis]KAB0444477.1 hypothetical protein CH314_04500 [Lysinibacillus fusiformis]